MLGKALFKLTTQVNTVPVLKVLGHVSLILGLLWICILNFLFARRHYISENAFTLTPGQSNLEAQREVYAGLARLTFEELQRLHSQAVPEQPRDNLDGLNYVMAKTRELGLESHLQEFPIYTGDSRKMKGLNLYTYVRAKRTNQKDVLLIAYKHNIENFNISYHLGVTNSDPTTYPRYSEITTALMLMKHLQNQDWLSRDILFLGYDGNLQYGVGVKRFLEEYYHARDSSMVRQGIIRQGIALDMKCDDFNVYGVQFEGNNGKLSDMDVFSLVTSTVQNSRLPHTLDDVGLFRENSGVQAFSRAFRSLFDTINDLGSVVEDRFQVKLPITRNVNVPTTLDFWSNMILGRSGDAHSHLVDYAVHAFTLKGYMDRARPRNSPFENVLKTATIVDSILRSESNLDEQLHAGSYFYFPVSTNTFQSSNIYIYPIVLCLLGFLIPRFISYVQKTRNSSRYYETTTYFLLSHLVGVIHLISPRIIEVLYSFVFSKDAQFKEELPEPIANTGDTKNMVLLWFALLIVTYHFLMELVFPFEVISVQFIMKKDKKEGGVLAKYWQYREDRSAFVDKELLKDYLMFFEVIYTIVMTINNFPVAVLNVISLMFYAHLANEFRKNGWARNVVLVGLPLLVFAQLNFTFYTWNSYLPMIRYMIIEFMTTGGGLYSFLLFNFCPYAQDIARILYQLSV